MKFIDILFVIFDLSAIFFSLISIFFGEATFGNYVWLTVAVLWGLEKILKVRERKSKE